jgi:aminoglycoside/choline kinase family phosphotransferase
VLKAVDHYIEHLAPKGTLLQGLCHGDFTLSNMLIEHPSKIHLIDMLDNFIETPLQDMAKLRQDTAFYWSLLFYQGSHRTAHISNLLASIDQIVVLFCERYDFYREYYLAFQLLNHLRLLPYAKQQDVVTHVTSVLNTLLKE